MKLQSFLALAFFVGLAQASFAQNSGRLSGTIKDEKGEAAGFANVALMQAADSALVSGAVTDINGSFSINTPRKPGAYFLRLSAIGFGQTTTPAFTIPNGDFSKNFGTLTLKEDVQLLKEVKVESMRPKIVNEADKMVVSVEGTALAATNTAFQVLAKSPGIWIDQDGNIQLNGQQGVRVMIDGRPTYLSAKELQSMLEGMSAENIKNIEIINNPSARYDAEGTAGIININLKKNTISGINGSMYAGYNYNGVQGYSTGLNLNYKTGKWSSFGSFDFGRHARFRDAVFTREFNTPESNTTFDQDAREDILRQTPSLRLGTDYDINENHSVGATLNLSQHKSSFDFRTDTYIRNGNSLEDLFIDADNYTENVYKNGTFNLHYMGKLDTLGSSLSADLDLARIDNSGNARFQNSFDSLAPGATDYRSLLTSENPTGYDIYAAKIDYTKALKNKRKLELGAKASRVVSDNELRFFTNLSEGRVADPSKSNHFIYDENIYAAYLNLSTPLSSKISVTAGLRAEQTVAKGISLSRNQETPREYLNLFPSVFVQQNISDNYQINYNYSRRIERPHYEQLNPFIFYLDPNTLVQGNPYLRPEYSHSLGMTHTFKKTYNLMLEYTVTKDFIAEVPVLNEETKITTFNRQNVDDSENLSATFVAPFKIMKNWDTNNNTTVAYQKFSTVLNNRLERNNQLFYLFQSNHNIILPKGFKLEVNAGYQGPAVWGLYRIQSQWWADMGVKKSFLQDKLEASLNVNDIFRSRQLIGGANVGDDINQFNQYFGSRSLGINLRYRFSRGEKFEMKQRNTNLEELNRAGGN